MRSQRGGGERRRGKEKGRGETSQKDADKLGHKAEYDRICRQGQ